MLSQEPNNNVVFSGLNAPVPPFLPVKKDFLKAKARRQLILEKQNGLCAYCDIPLTVDIATVDHLIPRSKGGGSRKKNLIVVCHTCNSLKGNISSVEEANERIYVFTEFIARLAVRGYLK